MYKYKIQALLLGLLALGLTPVSAASIGVSATINSDSPSAGIEEGNNYRQGTLSQSAQNDGLLQDFPNRSVVIVSNNKAFDSYMASQLRNVFRYPYYQATSRPYVGGISTDYLAAMAQSDQQEGKMADIYVAPQTEVDQYYTFRPIFGLFRDNDELYVRAAIKGSIYYYDTQSHKGGKVTKAYYGTADTLTMPSHRELYRDVTEQLLKALPYKRVPTDIPRYGQDSNANQTVISDIPSNATVVPTKTPSLEQFMQVEQPKKTKYDLSGLSVL